MYKDIVDQDHNIRTNEALAALSYLATDIAERLNFLGAEIIMRRDPRSSAKRADAIRYLATEAALFAGAMDKLGDEINGANTKALILMTSDLIEDAAKLDAAITHYENDASGLIDPLARLRAFFQTLFGRPQPEPQELKQAQAVLQAVTAINTQVTDLQNRTMRRWADQALKARSA